MSHPRVRELEEILATQMRDWQELEQDNHSGTSKVRRNLEGSIARLKFELFTFKRELRKQVK